MNIQSEIHGIITNLPACNSIFIDHNKLHESIKELLLRNNKIVLIPKDQNKNNGIGKSKIALDYSYHNYSFYKLIWLIKSESQSQLISDYLELAYTLNLPEKNNKNQKTVIKSVKDWLEKNRNWLLLFDNIRENTELDSFIPEPLQGHIIITADCQYSSQDGNTLQIYLFDRNQSIDYIKTITGQKDEKSINSLAETLDDLPIALELAAAYINTQQITLSQYLRHFESRHHSLEQEKQSEAGFSRAAHTSFLLVYDKLATTPFATEILSMCAFIHPASIQIKLIEKVLERHCKQKSRAGIIDLFPIAHVYEKLDKLSLITVNSSGISIHPMIRDMLLGQLKQQTKEQYMICLIQVLNELFPQGGYDKPECWEECLKLLPLAHAAIAHMPEPSDEFHAEYTMLASSIGLYHHGRHSYIEAESLYRRIIAIREKHLGPDHPDVATSISNLALLLWDQGKIEEAEILYHRTISIRENQFGNDHPEIATSLNNLAHLLAEQQKFSRAESLYRRALKIRQEKLPADHLLIAQSQNNLAGLLYLQGKYAESEPFFLHSLEIYEKQLGPDHLDVATLINNISVLMQVQGKEFQAELLYHRVVSIFEKIYGPDDPEVASAQCNLAILMQDQGKFAEAEEIYHRALQIREKHFGMEHPLTESTRIHLALFSGSAI